LHFLFLTFMPSLQVAEQIDQLLQAPQAPSESENLVTNNGEVISPSSGSKLNLYLQKGAT